MHEEDQRRPMMPDDALPRILVVGAHAGDCEVMTGSAVAQHTAAGGNAVLAHMTLGERGHPSLRAPMYAAQKRREAEAAAGMLGAGVVFLPYEDSNLEVTEEAKHRVAALIRREKPDIVMTHWGGSFHKDHAACHHIVNDAVFYAGLPDLNLDDEAHQVRALYYGENWEDPHDFRTDLYIDTSAGHDTWIEALRSYELFRGGLSSFPYLRYYDALSIVRGAEAAYRLAKAFAVPREARRIRRQRFDGEIPYPLVTAASIIVHREEAGLEPRP